ncbi:hypothetical protein [Caldalkalibacillus salinus]|uniref:hypothetical protein n=1 Tax=Caldalkalibacillus salinus TaxID=2803787 RepID=UPI001923C15E|nr:hypothetical protein [Caldalkalibacillus salinus]
MTLAGYQAEVKVSGSPISFTALSTNANDDATVFQVQDNTKRIWERSTDITVERSTDGSNWSVVNEREFQVNRLEGSISFGTSQADASIRVSGEYLPLTKVGGAYEYTYELASENQTIHEFGHAHQKRLQGKKDVTTSISKWYDTDQTFIEALQKGKAVLLEFYAGQSTPDIRMWGLVSSEEISAGQEGVVEESIEFEAIADKEGRVMSIG